MLGVGSDTGLLLGSLRSRLAAIGRDRKIDPTLTPARAPIAPAPLDRPAESFRPDRLEVMNELGAGPKLNIQPGVVFECLVGAHNEARKLTTGIVRFDPAVHLAYHTHPCTEAITLLAGSAVVEVEGRRYRLAPLDNVVIPPGVPHAVENASTEHEAMFHIAFPTEAVSRELVDAPFTPQAMADDATGFAGRGLEHVTRFAFADRLDAGLGATFIDYFNDELTPGIEMSGGYGLFHPGGRLLAHIHDFDESICIIDGAATCVVEGRRYAMNDYTTALQPRGRVHYFVNESQDPMAMIWVYAGPDPQRIVVDERNATIEGNPWR